MALTFFSGRATGKDLVDKMTKSLQRCSLVFCFVADVCTRVPCHIFPLQIEYATLLDADMKIINSRNKPRLGELFDPEVSSSFPQEQRHLSCIRQWFLHGVSGAMTRACMPQGVLLCHSTAV